MLESTLSQGKKCALAGDKIKNKLHIIHCLQQHHWIVANTVNSIPEVLLMDSMHKSVDQETQLIICNLFQYSSNQPTIKLIKPQKQKGVKDCGLFAIAIATTIAFGDNPSKQVFRQESM